MTFFSDFFMNRIGINVIRLDEVDSTNLYAERLLETGMAGEGTVITAGFQYAGKGQGENTWESDRGMNLLASVILSPAFLPASDQFVLNMAMTLAVCDLLSSKGIEPFIKWPNDIYAEGKKIAGLLISHRVSGNMLEHTIVGIGLNLNQKHFPATLPNPVSVKMLTGADFLPEVALNDLASMINERYGQLSRGMATQIGKEYFDHFQGLGKWLKVETARGQSEGRMLGVDEFGRLILEFRDGSTEHFSHGEIRISEFAVNF